MRNLMWALFAAGGLLAGGGLSWAGDTVRLGGPAAQNDMQGDTDLVRGGGGGHGGGFGGGGRGGFGGYGHGGFGGYGRGGYGYGGYGRGGYGYGGYGRGYGYGGYGWGGYGLGGYGLGGYGLGGYYPYYGGYYGGSYPYPVYYPYYYPYSSNYYYYPIVGQAAPTMTLQANPYSQAPLGNPSMPAQPYGNPFQAPGGNGTFPYDGGPRTPIPMPAPGQEVNPANDRGILPLDGKLVSIPSQTTGGFSPVGLPPFELRTSAAKTTVTTTTTTTTPAPRVVYPAYGDEPIPAAPRKTSSR